MPMMISNQIAKFKFFQYQLRAISRNLMFTKISHYAVYFSAMILCYDYYTRSHLPFCSIAVSPIEHIVIICSTCMHQCNQYKPANDYIIGI